jgi:nitrogen-specific signal transduction histidine kinase
MNNDENSGIKNNVVIKHDIKNQLSNISLALEQLRFEVPDESEDCQYYVETIFTSIKKINTILDSMQH